MGFITARFVDDAGRQYLAGAEAKLAAMNKQGGSFLWWRMEFPDAVVEITRGTTIDTIRITSSGGFSIAMDAGLIDLKSTAPAAPARYYSADRLDTVATLSYNAAFVLGATQGKWAAWRSYPTGVPLGQLAGTVVVPPFAGHLKAGSLAPSFTAKRKAVTPATNPPTWVDDPADDALLAKKLMASKCPASMFTGRTRFYVQSMYGRPSYDYGGDASTEPTTSTVATPLLDGTSNQPALLLPAFKRSDDVHVYPNVSLNTSAGVFFDATSGQHWLMTVVGDGLNIYPLISSRTGESMRSYLAGKAVGVGVFLGPADKEKLEAYILAYCLPDVRNYFYLPVGPATNNYSMGYGWHWNWSGTAADIVTSTTFDQGGGNSGMESTWRRMTVSRTTSPNSTAR